MKVRILASGPLSFKAFVLSESKVTCALRFMPYFMLSKIAFSGYEERAVSLISCGPNNGHLSL
jgi:hypothetical protein